MEMKAFNYMNAMQAPPNIVRKVCNWTFVAYGGNFKFFIGK